jgi:L-asparaginase / beta-aspartyl-peptidase
VVLDRSGDLASATSTGGLLGKYAGRVGDSPIAGAGTYARSDWGAISATGHGETIMRTVLGFAALQALSQEPTREALLRVLDAATARIGGRGGAITVLPDGRSIWARNTAHMGVAWVSESSGLASAF